MYPNALQFGSIPLRAMDNATLLSYLHNVDDKGKAENAAPMRTNMGQFWTDFDAAFVLYDQVFNPSRKSLESEDLKDLDNGRDNSLGAYHEAVLGLQRNPNDAKRQAARLLNLNYDTYKPDRGQEYMKETELISQMTTEIRNTAELSAAIQLLGLEDYLADLEQKNQAFADLMAGRTTSTEGYQKGAVAEARADLEAKYQLFRQMLNVASIYEGDTEYRPFLLAANAEVEHFRQILARKGVSTGSSSSDNGGGSTDNNGSGSGTGSGTGTITPGGGDNGSLTPDPSPSGEGDDNGSVQVGLGPSSE